MAKKLRQKIKQHTGASISFALAFFLVAAMVCSTIVAASVTAVKRTTDEKERMQAQLTLESCAKQLEKGLRNTTGTVKVTKVTTIATGVETKTTDVSASGDMAGVVLPALQVVKTEIAYDSSTQAGDLTIKLTGDTDATQAMLLGGTDPITVTYTMQPATESESEEDVKTDFNMVFTLTLKGKNNSTYTALLSAVAARTIDISTPESPVGEQTEVTKTDIKWLNFRINSF